MVALGLYSFRIMNVVGFASCHTALLFLFFFPFWLTSPKHFKQLTSIRVRAESCSLMKMSWFISPSSNYRIKKR